MTDLESQPELVVGELLEVANKAVQKHLDRLADENQYDLAYWDYELDVTLFQNDVEFTPWKKYKASKLKVR